MLLLLFESVINVLGAKLLFSPFFGEHCLRYYDQHRKNLRKQKTEHRTWCKADFMLSFFVFVRYRCRLFGHGPDFHFQLEKCGTVESLYRSAFDCLQIWQPPRPSRLLKSIRTLPRLVWHFQLRLLAEWMIEKSLTFLHVFRKLTKPCYQLEQFHARYQNDKLKYSVISFLTRQL